jgi:ectoine hydroxylase-related dioxygenase (phytanoyl-CoA dioxygenase family)
MITREFTILNHQPERSQRKVEIEAPQEQLDQLVNEGYLVRPRLIPDAMLARLRDAADRLEAEELPKVKGAARNRSFGGLFVRNIIDRHAVFQVLIDYGPLLSVARAVLGPQVQLHGSVLRIAFAEEPEQHVEWHFHQRVVPRPAPPFFTRPEVLDNLIYLDDLTPDSGPLVVLPKTHRINEALPSGDFSEKPGQVVVTCPAGSVVTASAALWHRAMDNKPGSGKRRLVIIGYSPVWMKQIDRPSAGAGRGLTDALVPGATQDMRELLGMEGFY